MTSHGALRALLGVSKTGPVLDTLARAAGTDGIDALRTAPSKDVVLELARKCDAVTLEHLVSKVSDPEVLVAVLAKEKRKGVRIELVKNPALPMSAVKEAFDKAYDSKSRDAKMVTAVLTERTSSEVFTILEGRDILCEEAGTALAAAAVELGGEERYRHVLERVQGRRIPLATLANRVTKAGVSKELVKDVFTSLKEVVGAIDGNGNGYGYNRNSFVPVLLEWFTEEVAKDSELARWGLGLGWWNVTAKVLELTKAGDVEMTLADVCEHVDKGGLEALMRDLSNEEVEVGTATAAALLERNAYGFDNLVARGRFSQEALDLVARTARSSTTRGYALVRLEDVEAVKEALTGRDPDMLGSALRFEVGRVNDLLGAGLEEDLVLALYANADHYGGRRQAPSAELLELVARRGTSSHFRGHSFSTAQVPLLLERLKETSGSRVKDSVIGALLGWFESTTSKVREGSGLTEEELTLRARFLREGGWSVRASALEGGNLEPGELTALSQVLEGDELTGFVQTAQNLGAARHNTSSERGRAVLKEAMALTALDWGAMGTTAAELVHEEFTSAFGDDVRLWEAALTLMESWDAPLADLVAVVKEF